jgi:hypothetical protein
MTTQAISRQLEAGGFAVRRGENLHATSCEQSHSHFKHVSPTICNYPLKSVGVSVTHGKSSYSDLRGSTRWAGVWHRCFRADPVGPSPLTNFGAEIYAPNRPQASAGILPAATRIVRPRPIDYASNLYSFNVALRLDRVNDRTQLLDQ